MAGLVLINGLPASGKSTIARRYADEHPLALALDLDVVRSMLGRWLDQPAEAGLAARRMAVEMARVHLQGGHDVVVPQFLVRLEFIAALEQLARDTRVPFVEVVLLISAAESEARFLRRSGDDGRSEHRDAALLLEQGGGPRQLADMHARLAALVTKRPQTHVIATTTGAIEAAYRDFLDVLDGS